MLLTGVGVFSTGNDSPVRADWFTNRSFAVISRASAGAMTALRDPAGTGFPKAPNRVE